MKTLVVYYSAEGHTKKLAETISNNLSADIFEIIPDPIYTEEDLDWTNPNSRCSRENDDEDLRNVKLTNVAVPNWESYERIILCYPIWWGVAAWPVNSFVKAVDFTGKEIIPVCTSHSSGLGDSDLLLRDDSSTGDWKEGIRFFQDANEEKIKAWTDTLE